MARTAACHSTSPAVADLFPASLLAEARANALGGLGWPAYQQITHQAGYAAGKLPTSAKVVSGSMTAMRWRPDWYPGLPSVTSPWLAKSVAVIVPARPDYIRQIRPGLAPTLDIASAPGALASAPWRQLPALTEFQKAQDTQGARSTVLL